MRKVTAVYIGRRITTKDKLAYFWDFTGDVNPRGYKKQLAPAVIGESWEFTQNEKGDILINVDNCPVQLSHLSIPKDKVAEWEALSQSSCAHDAYRRMKLKLAKRRSQFDGLMQPLREMANTLSGNQERAAFIQRVVAELWQDQKK